MYQHYYLLILDPEYYRYVDSVVFGSLQAFSKGFTMAVTKSPNVNNPRPKTKLLDPTARCKSKIAPDSLVFAPYLRS